MSALGDRERRVWPAWDAVTVAAQLRADAAETAALDVWRASLWTPGVRVGCQCASCRGERS